MNPTARKALRIFAPLLIFALLIFGFGKRHGPAPALGNFLQPFHGAWVPPDDDLVKLKKHLLIPGLKAPVTVKYDRDRIPHIFAQNDDDLYAVQGFITASDRLWQMEFISRLASGRLSEVVGRKTLELDKMFLRLGLRDAAEDTLKVMEQDEATKRALDAYTRGVNAYIATLSERNLPLEYKLLEYTPEKWTSLNAALLLKFMAYNLSFWAYDLQLSRSFTRISEADFLSLFPVDPVVEEPIIPRDTKWKIQASPPAAPAQIFHATQDQILPYPTPNPGNGSNNWALSARKSTTGYPIVSNDVHLGYQLPALWYEVQLHSPTQNVLGASMPGSPGIILGFNKKIAWAVTNGGTDIVDWFELKFRDEHGYEYLHEGSWRPVIASDVKIKVKGEAEPVTITLRHTHFGPIVYEKDEVPLNPLIARGLAMKWGALEPSNELASFLKLNRAKDFSECHDAIENYAYPAQNFICADAKSIGQFHQGRFPIRWRGQGRMISDGSDPVYDWNDGYISSHDVPQIINPQRGFVSSANQPPTTSGYPFYLGGPFEQPYRARRINEILNSKAKFSPGEMLKMQSDTLVLLARDLVPTLIKGLPQKERSPLEKEAIEILSKWDFRAEPDRVAATLFDKWSTLLNEQIWSDQFPNQTAYYWPRWNTTANLILNEPTSKWFDRIETDEVETLPILLDRTLSEAVKLLREKLGANIQGWTWGRYRPTFFPHLARVAGLGSQETPTRGHALSLFANRGDHGPTWKSVVALGPNLQAWGIYPGGQSGNPSSRYYDTFMQDWADGKLRPIEFLENEKNALRFPFKDFTFSVQKESL